MSSIAIVLAIHMARLLVMSEWTTPLHAMSSGEQSLNNVASSTPRTMSCPSLRRAHDGNCLKYPLHTKHQRALNESAYVYIDETFDQSCPDCCPSGPGQGRLPAAYSLGKSKDLQHLSSRASGDQPSDQTVAWALKQGSQAFINAWLCGALARDF